MSARGCPVFSSFLRKRLLVGSLQVLILQTGTVAFAAQGADKMPPMAPSIQRDQPLENATTSGDTATFVRRATPPEKEPLTGNVSQDRPHNAFQSAASYMAHVPLGLTAGTNVKVPPETYRAWLEKTHPEFMLNIGKVSPGDVVEVKGAWDNAGKTLNKLGIPSSKIKGGQLRDYPLDHVKVLIINCDGNVPRESYQRIRDFVMHGGFLLTTDWALDHMLTKTFPGYVEWNRKENRKAIYDSEVSDPDPVLFRNTVSEANWKLDPESHLVSVMKPDSVRVLVRSRSLSSEDGQGIMAITFPFGRGQVLHMVGHFDNAPAQFRFGDTLPDPAPVIGISLRQALAANFVVAGLDGAHVPSR